MTTHYRQWVVYHGERRIGPAKSLEAVESICERDRIPLGEQVGRYIDVETPLDEIYF
jgi:hypothetical protein